MANAWADSDHGSRRRDFQVRVGVAPQEGKSGKPVLSLDQLSDPTGLFRFQYADARGEFRACDFSADRAGGNHDLRVVTDTLYLAQFTIGDEVEFVIVFGKPDGRVYGDSTLAEGREAEVALAVDFCRNRYHQNILNCNQGWL